MYARERGAGGAARRGGDAAERPSRARPPGEAILALQRQAGNAAVAALLAPEETLAVQRARTTRSTTRGAAKKTGSGGLKKPRRTPPKPALIAAETSREANHCGDFSLVRQWAVNNPGGRGCIVQKVTRTFAVERYEAGTGWVPVTGAGLDAYVSGTGSTVHGTETTYWEAWAVRADGSVTDGDQFALCSLTDDLNRIRRTTRGSYTITGMARFYPRLTLKALRDSYGFGTTAVRSANGLHASLAAPVGLPRAAGSGLGITVTVTWDSGPSEARAKSKLTVTT